MNVLLIGSGRLADAIIDKLNKNGDRIYLLTGRRDTTFFRKHVFERYNFTYEDDSIKDIFDSVKPDVTIFTGAADSNFDWKKERQEAVRYTASLINILAAFSLMREGRFVYISSQAVYGGSYPNNVQESKQPSPDGFKAMAIAQGEEICTNYRNTQGSEVAILRLDHLYSVPQKGKLDENPCFSMCLDALKTGKISASDRDVFSMLYLKDAVELIYKVLAAPKLSKSIYHISSMEEINGIQLAEIVSKAMGSGVTIVNNSHGEYKRVILDGSGFQNEFGQKILTHYQEGVARVAQYMKRHSDAFIHSEDVGGDRLGRIWHTAKKVFAYLAPFLENLIGFAVFFALANMAAGGEFFAKLDFYLLYVLLFAIVYGQQQAVFSGLLGVTGYCFQQMYTRSGFEVLLDYNTYVWMAQLFIVGMVVGHIRDQLRSVKQESKDEIAYLEGKLADIMEINDSNVRMKQNFEAQLVNQKGSLGKLYEITSSLEQYAPEEVLFYAARVLSQLMECKDVAIYTVAGGGYARLFSSTSSEARVLGSSIRYTAMAEVYGELKEHRVYINKTMTDKLPLMASAVYAGEDMNLIFMLWGIPWQRMTLAEANRLAVIGQMIQSAVLQANRYLEALRSQRYLEGTNLLSESAFTVLVRAFFGARDQGLTECTLLEILAEKQDCSHAAALLEPCIRQTDYMGVMHNGKLYVLLSNTEKGSAGPVMNRFREAGYESRIEKEAAL